MSMRKINFPRDLQPIADLAATAFQYPDNPEWSVQEDEKEGLMDTVKTLKRLWPLIALFQKVSPAMRDFMRGYIWEEDGQPVGLNLLQRRGTTDKWFVATVGVLPEYRQRGIARKLVLAGLDLIRERGGKIALLDVISGNVPAYSLYEKVCFENFSGNVVLEYEPSDVVPSPQIRDGYSVETISLSDWEIPLDLEKRIAPENVQQSEPVEEERFRLSLPRQLIVKLLNFGQGIRTERFCVHESNTGQVVGRGLSQGHTRPVGRNVLFLRLDPAHADLTSLMIEYILNKVTQTGTGHIIEIPIPDWQSHLLDSFLSVGFKKRVEFHRMGIML
jgi:ribosomal protein S18 acetylase RimI-like enzyme